MRTFGVDLLCYPRCSGRLRLVALMTEPKEKLLSSRRKRRRAP
jgi:hypothetical protein